MLQFTYPYHVHNTISSNKIVVTVFEWLQTGFWIDNRID
jgi:hypothetical protein